MSMPWVVGWQSGGRDEIKVFDTRKAAETFAATLKAQGFIPHCWEM